MQLVLITLITGQETAASNFGDFTRQYTTDTNLANNARADLQKQITGGVDTLQGNIAGGPQEHPSNQVANQTATQNRRLQMRHKLMLEILHKLCVI